MKTITIFITSWCPYCKLAQKFIDELIAEHEEYKDIIVEYVDEEKEVERAKGHDYFYVPTLYIDKEKLHEGVPTKENIKMAFDKALNR